MLLVDWLRKQISLYGQKISQYSQARLRVPNNNSSFDASVPSTKRKHFLGCILDDFEGLKRDKTESCNYVVASCSNHPFRTPVLPKNKHLQHQNKVGSRGLCRCKRECKSGQWIQMSKQLQEKLTNTDQNGVSVIQSQAQSNAPRSAGATAGLQQVPQLVPISPGGGGGKATPPSKMKKPIPDKDSEEYRQRRERNNLAVKKSRMRSKQKAQDTQQRVNELKEENERLEAKIKLLSKELSVLKDLFLEHAHNLADNVQPPAVPVAPGDLCSNSGSSGNSSSQ